MRERKLKPDFSPAYERAIAEAQHQPPPCLGHAPPVHRAIQPGRVVDWANLKNPCYNSHNHKSVSLQEVEECPW